MGVYLFRSDVLTRVLEECAGPDFGRDIIPAAIRRYHVHAHRFYGYWEDIGTIRSFYRANLALADRAPTFSFHAPSAPIYTRPRYLAAARIDGCRIDRAIVGDGSELREATIRGALLGIRTIIRPGVELSDTIVMGADFYETPEETEQARTKGLPPVGIGEATIIEGAIIDKNACIGRGVRIRRLAGRRDEDHESHSIRDGIVVVPKHAVIADGTVI
jgi:glucose-1-phosphate adenylyltransferase